MNIRGGVLHVTTHTNFVLDRHHCVAAFGMENALVAQQQVRIAKRGRRFLSGGLGFFKRLGQKLPLRFQVDELLLELDLLDLEIGFSAFDFPAGILSLLHEIDFVILDLVDFSLETYNLVAQSLEFVVFSSLKLLRLVLGDLVATGASIQLKLLSFDLNLFCPLPAAF
jgi:hypothetical protein